jgi:GDPmannose 4,6-dehydratase
MIGSNKNYNILTKKFDFKIKIGGKELVKKFYNSI